MSFYTRKGRTFLTHNLIFFGRIIYQDWEVHSYSNVNWSNCILTIRPDPGRNWPSQPTWRNGKLNLRYFFSPFAFDVQGNRIYRPPLAPPVIQAHTKAMILFSLPWRRSNILVIIELQTGYFISSVTTFHLGSPCHIFRSVPHFICARTPPGVVENGWGRQYPRFFIIMSLF